MKRPLRPPDWWRQRWGKAAREVLAHFTHARPPQVIENDGDAVRAVGVILRDASRDCQAHNRLRAVMVHAFVTPVCRLRTSQVRET